MANFRRERLPGVIPDDAGGRNFYGLSAFRRSSSGSLATLAAMRRASSRLSRLVAERCDTAICREFGGEAEVRGLRLKRR
jgi:hypothetical protein